MAEMNVYQKLQSVRAEIVNEGTRKSGKNPFSNYSYFELDDFLPKVMLKFKTYGLCSVVSFPSREEATLTIYNADNPSEFIVFTAPMGSATLKACHDAQNLGAAETYARRYLYIAALELTEHDALETSTADSGEGKGVSAIDERRERIAGIIAKIKQVDETAYRQNIAEILRKHNKSAKAAINDVGIADEIIKDLAAFYKTIEPKEET
jgi:hypothetical protein